MEEQEVVRFIAGLKKKHGNSFAVHIRYLTASGKVRWRSGQFLQLTEDNVLILRNEEKGGDGKYPLSRIREIGKAP